MTERDKLIEILKNDSCQSPMLCDPNCKYAKLERCYEERTADYLLENGVTILPCRVGDTLYYHKLECDGYYEGKPMWNIIESTVSEVRITKKGLLLIMSSGRIFTYVDFDKIIFRTKEKAEKALAERNGE